MERCYEKTIGRPSWAVRTGDGSLRHCSHMTITIYFLALSELPTSLSTLQRYNILDDYGVKIFPSQMIQAPAERAQFCLKQCPVRCTSNNYHSLPRQMLCTSVPSSQIRQPMQCPHWRGKKGPNLPIEKALFPPPRSHFTYITKNRSISVGIPCTRLTKSKQITQLLLQGACAREADCIS